MCGVVCCRFSLLFTISINLLLGAKQYGIILLILDDLVQFAGKNPNVFWIYPEKIIVIFRVLAGTLDIATLHINVVFPVCVALDAFMLIGGIRHTRLLREYVWNLILISLAYVVSNTYVVFLNLPMKLNDLDEIFWLCGFPRTNYWTLVFGYSV